MLSKLTRAGFGGSLAGGAQYISWIHHVDFVRAIEFLIECEDIEGAVNLCAPTPLPQREFQRALRKAWGAPVRLPATRWMIALGAFLLRTDSEPLLKSRRVVPGRFSSAGFAFKFPRWTEAADELVAAWRRA